MGGGDAWMRPLCQSRNPVCPKILILRDAGAGESQANAPEALESKCCKSSPFCRLISRGRL